MQKLLLEFDFANGIEKIINHNKPLVAYPAVGNGGSRNRSADTYDLVENVLKKNYHLFIWESDYRTCRADSFQIINYCKTYATFSDAEKLKIDEYECMAENFVFYRQAEC